MDKTFDIETSRVTGIPPTIYYIPNFISKTEEEYLLKQVYAAPKPKWTQLSNRRLQNWGGLPHEKGMIPEKMPEWLDKYGKKIANLGAFGEHSPNHVLVNEYLPGQGIMPHTDGPLYFPVVSNMTLGGHTLLDFYHPLSTQQDEEKCDERVGGQLEQDACPGASFGPRHFASLLLEPCSLVVTCGDMYSAYLHGIQDRVSDLITDNVVNLGHCSAKIGDTLQRTTRVSLTIRYVPKVMKAKWFLGGKNR